MFNDSRNTKNLMQAVPVMVMILVILVLIYTLVLYNSEWDSSKQEFIEIGSELTGQAATGMEMWLEDQIRMSSLIAEHPSIVNLCLNPLDELYRLEARDLLDALNARYPYYEALPIALFSKQTHYVPSGGALIRVDDGEFLLDSVGGNIVGKGGYDLTYISAIKEGKPYYVGEVYPSINSEEPIIAISHPIRHNDELIGAAVVAPKMDYFTSRFVTPAAYGETGYMFIIDGRGLIVAHPDSQHIMKPFSDQGEAEKQIISRILSGQTYFQEPYDDMQKSYYVKRVQVGSDSQPYEWYMVFTMCNAEIYHNADHLLKISITLLLGGSVLIAVLMYFYTKSFEAKVKEIQQLELSKQLEIEVAARTSRLAEMAIQDGLTKLYNHEATYKALGVAIAGARTSLQPLSVIMLDLDYFKMLNDTFGHQFGDQVLKETANVLKNTVRSSDVVGRYGGEEFMVILPGAPKKAAIATAERIEKGLRAIKLERDIKITSSMGVAAWVGEDVDDLVSKVDRLLYQAKRNGRGRIESIIEQVSPEQSE